MLDPVINTLQPFVVALLIGLMAGIERERSQQEQEVVVGMRTFTLIALLGAIAGYINVMELTLSLSLFVIVMVGLGYWRSTHANPERGLTTEIAAAIIFSLGYMAIKSPILAGLLGILLVAILFFRSRLHWFAKDVLQPQEIATFILLLIFIFIIIPFFPDRPIDIWNLVNPRKLAQVLVFIAIIQFGSYIAKRIAGARVGLLITGFLGGFVSSTVVFLDLARVAKNQPTSGDQFLALVC